MTYKIKPMLAEDLHKKIKQIKRVAKQTGMRIVEMCDETVFDYTGKISEVCVFFDKERTAPTGEVIQATYIPNIITVIKLEPQPKSLKLTDRQGVQL